MKTMEPREMPMPPKMKTKRIIILLPALLHRNVKETARKEDLSVSQLVRKAIRAELQRCQK
jgi:post-segregation antitoxin (ccd killing protein)